MDTELIIAGMSLIGTLVGTFAGIYVSGTVTQYRLRQLEKKVQAHNNLISRTYQLEREYAVLDERLRVANHRIGDLEKEENE